MGYSFFRGREGGERENTNEKQSELLGVGCLAISQSIFQKGGALQSTRSWGVSRVTVSTLRKMSNGLASSKGHKTTSSVGKMVLSPNSTHRGLKARSWGVAPTQGQAQSLTCTITSFPKCRDSALLISILIPGAWNHVEVCEHLLNEQMSTWMNE